MIGAKSISVLLELILCTEISVSVIHFNPEACHLGFLIQKKH